MIKFAHYFFLPNVVSKRLPFYKGEKQMFEKEHYHRDNCNVCLQRCFIDETFNDALQSSDDNNAS